jgi:hypothetical protein
MLKTSLAHAMNDERSAEVADRSIMEKLRKLPR